jgi:hypothetical protein
LQELHAAPRGFGGKRRADCAPPLIADVRHHEVIMATAVSGSVNTVLYTPRQIYVASLLGSPAAAAWFMSLNHRALLQSDNEHQIVLLGGIATIAVIIVAFSLPERVPTFAWPLVYSVAIYLFAQLRFESTVQKHFAAGGQKGSWWRVIWVSLLFAIGLIALLLVVAPLLPSLIE